ncbi:MATE family efflux transporter [Alkaliphilus sp. B6464]|uniref:MATE family efflux transporter n=1 Tax=Alkaliphilus sp. B6464 TaxID=2731219 RepID=UPI001BA494D6|nr:MATE family efflux transporter [Alkaliphilus sp. B6464]QUH19699.1 MATE family efflux transporter [Alkaliphilus sp. B6464]
MKKLLKDKKFFILLFTLALPITFQNLISSSLNLIDNLMIGKLGETEIAAVGLINQFFFIFMLCLSGINAGASIFMSQYWGKKNIDRIKKVLGLNIILGLLTAIVFSIVGLAFPSFVIRVFTKDQHVIALGTTYLRFVALGFVMTSITQAYSTALRSTEQPNTPMYASLIGVACNAILNWVLIFGNLGFPPMGVKGAAIATTIARGAEMFYVLIVVYGINNIIGVKLREIFSFNREFVMVYFRTSYSVIINEIIWALGMTAYSVVYAKISISAVAGMQIATTISNIFMVVCIGLASASAIMIGTQIGAEHEDIAKDYAFKLGVLSPFIGILIGIGIWVSAPFILQSFNISHTTYQSTLMVLRIMAVFCPLRFFNVLMIIGVFRGGGDTTYSMIVQGVTLWLYAIPLSFVAAVYFKISLPMVYFIICTEEIIKAIFEVKRFLSNKWMRNVIEQAV